MTLRRNPLWPRRRQGRYLQREAFGLSASPHAPLARALLLLVGWGLNTRNIAAERFVVVRRQFAHGGSWSPMQKRNMASSELPARGGLRLNLHDTETKTHNANQLGYLPGR